MSARRRVWVAVAGCLLAVVASSGRVAWADPLDRVRAKIERLMVEQSVPSIAVAVARDGEIIWEQGFGCADRENRVPATEHTMFSLASISKPVTATGLMVLVSKGKLDLDASVNEVLGDAKLVSRVCDPAEATLRHVATHTSGLPTHFQFFYHDRPERPPTRDETIRRYANLFSPPGERYNYSNLGYGILDYVIERTDGRSYADFMREEVFLPLGLTHMSIDIGPGLESHAAVRYSPEGLPIPFYEFDHPGASAVYASAHDLVRFGQFHLKEHLPDQKQILSDELIDAMQQSAVDTGGGGGYGIGWSLGKSRTGYRTVSHSGGMPGVSTMLTLVPEQRLAVAVLCNESNGAVYRMPEEIVQALVEPKEEDADKEPGGADENSDEPSETQSVSQLTGHWQGQIHTYEGPIDLKLWVLASGDVHVQVGDDLKALLNKRSAPEGELRGTLLGELPTADARRTPHRLALSVKLHGEQLQGEMRVSPRVDRTRGIGAALLCHWVELTRATP